MVLNSTIIACDLFHTFLDFTRFLTNQNYGPTIRSTSFPYRFTGSTVWTTIAENPVFAWLPTYPLDPKWNGGFNDMVVDEFINAVLNNLPLNSSCRVQCLPRLTTLFMHVGWMRHYL
jgi:hypothetical protein